MEVSNCRLPLTILVRQPHRLKKAGGVCGRSAARFFVARIDGSCASVRLDATRQSRRMAVHQHRRERRCGLPPLQSCPDLSVQVPQRS